jgi:hypothetical protein
MTRGTKYLKQASLGGFGLILIAAPWILTVPGSFKVYSTANSLQTEAGIKGAEIEQDELVRRRRDVERKETSKALKANGDFLPSHDRLRMSRYLYDEKRDPRPDTSGYQKGETVYVFDSSWQCIGRIKDGEWQFKPRYQGNICKDFN